jgi:hypothetical protein
MKDVKEKYSGMSNSIYRNGRMAKSIISTLIGEFMPKYKKETNECNQP